MIPRIALEDEKGRILIAADAGEASLEDASPAQPAIGASSRPAPFFSRSL